MPRIEQIENMVDRATVANEAAEATNNLGALVWTDAILRDVPDLLAVVRAALAVDVPLTRFDPEYQITRCCHCNSYTTSRIPEAIGHSPFCPGVALAEALKPFREEAPDA